MCRSRRCTLTEYRLYDDLVVTDRDTYLTDIIAGTLRTAAGTVAIEPEQENANRISRDFVAAIQERRAPLVPGPAVLPAMRVLQAVQDDWNARHGARSIPGRA
jgi:2-hydroxy-4-carboxymuconate semialdehyde hemiacetal dehydrogenase